MCRFLSTGEISSIDKGTVKAQALKTEAVLKKFRELAATCGLADKERTKFFGKVEHCCYLVCMSLPHRLQPIAHITIVANVCLRCL